MKRYGLAFAAAGAAFVPLQAFAACTSADYSVVPLGDTAFTVLFDTMQVDAPGGTTGEASCFAEVAPGNPDGFSVFTVDHRGFVFGGETQSASLTAIGPNGETLIRTWQGPFDAYFEERHYVGTAPGQDLTIDVTLDVDGGDPSEENALADLDSTDFARVGFTTWANVQASLDQLAAAAQAAAVHAAATAGLLIGDLAPIEGPNGGGAIAAVGSGLIGVTGRYNVGNGLSVLGGVGIFTQSAGGADVGPSLMLAGAVRYVAPTGEPLRFFGEVGGHLAPRLGLALTRDNANLDQPGTATGTGMGFLAGVHIRAGALYAIDPRNEIALSATLSHSALGLRDYSENFGPDNLFAASIEDGVFRTTTLEATLAWTTTLSDRLDLTLEGTVGRHFGNGEVVADVDFVGTGAGTANAGTFAQIGARLGWQASERTSIDAFVVHTGGDEIGRHTQFGAALNLAF